MMHKSVALLLCFFCMSFASTGKLNKVTINVSNIKNPTGKLMVAVFDCEENYLKTALLNMEVEIDQPGIKQFVLQLPEGEYAVAIFQDTNANGVLDKNIIGIPKEAFGFSNISMGLFGPPSFKNTKFSLLQSGLQINVCLKHF